MPLLRREKPYYPRVADVFGTPIEEVYSSTEAKNWRSPHTIPGHEYYLELAPLRAPECLAAAHSAIDNEGAGTTVPHGQW